MLATAYRSIDRKIRTQSALVTVASFPSKLLKPQLNANTFHSASSLFHREKLSTTELDEKWSNIWKKSPSRLEIPHLIDSKTGKPLDREKYYALSMFPYPSGMLHIGHLRVYTISDVLARYRRMNGYNVIHAMGWDAFGLPAENAAIERGIDPETWTLSNIQKMKDQMNIMFADFDWEREIVTCSPDYYKHTQQLFLKLYKAGLAYRKEAVVNWDPIEKTVLANEQVDDEGRSWRSGAIVEKKYLEQWFLGITKYAPELLEDLSILKDWPERVKTMQKNWIGKSQGATIIFPLSTNESLTAFTTRPDTLYAVQYVALSLNHPIVKSIAQTDQDLADFLERAADLPEDTKEGYRLKNVYAANPLNSSKHNLPVFVAPYVLDNYGHGSVMGCPGHDTRDYEFWKQNMPSVSVVETVVPPSNYVPDANSPPIYTGKDGKLNEVSGPYSGMDAREGGKKIIQDLESTNLAKFDVQWRLRDWLISRQRFWGAPIPIIHCDSCGTVPVPDDELPVLLPRGLNGPLNTSPEFVHTHCPSCGGKAKRDTDTMDTFMDSSWYFFRYTDPHNTNEIFDYKKASELMPVDIYVGGIEHAILHLLYSRFISKFLAKNGNWSGGDLNGEPIKRLVTQGMVHGKTTVCPETGKFLRPHEIDYENDDPNKPLVKASQKPALVSYEKMSKSKYNGADPGECIKTHGADATRAHILFQAPVSDVLNWDESQIVGVKRWLSKVSSFTTSLADAITESANKTQNVSEFLATIKGQAYDVKFDKLSKAEQKMWIEIQKLIKSITDSFHDSLSLNTVISDYMKLTNAIQNTFGTGPFDNRSLPVALYALEKLLKVMAPVTPVNASDNWQYLQKALNPELKSSSIFAEAWPQLEAIPGADLGRFSIIINGKRRFVINASKSLAGKEKELMDLVYNSPESKEWLEDKNITKISVSPKGFAVTIVTN
ncbi:uncharacterized protein SAPINGB_P001339 [Magnusiomyces paraingens]|uniref:leucine--tRNA ligase n=1 Tax=Magnusiomyces paraingens TaxID=2606893 RepID=A0A5E8B579_9ASCO|nr:uncharacterized protein SAPINGB_P001339 [Saprochaete ingens]VVT46691.1 unnamed protein product [Saprochaete ingens]